MYITFIYTAVYYWITCIALSSYIKITPNILRKSLEPFLQEFQRILSCTGKSRKLKSAAIISGEWVMKPKAIPVLSSPLLSTSLELLEYEKPTPTGESRNNILAAAKYQLLVNFSKRTLNKSLSKYSWIFIQITPWFHE